MAEDPRIPDENNPETRPFWDGTRAGKFLLRRCPACSRSHWYPRTICPHCFTAETEWFEASGAGTIYSYTVSRSTSRTDVLAYVELAEGPRMLTNIIDAEPAELAIGKAVKVLLQERESGPPVPVFRLA
jgi:uncharacterized OB-fold protein